MAGDTCKFQIMSDLHLETHPSYDYDFPQTAPYLALLGDIGHVVKEQLHHFLTRQLLRYRVVFYLLGNHEPWHISFDFAKTKMEKFAQNVKRLRADDPSIGEFVFLDKTTFDLNDEITVLGCTLFSNVPAEHAAEVQSRLVDFRDILHWDVGEHVDAHLEDLKWLNTQVAEYSSRGRKVVIFTHHSPCVDPRATDPRHRNSNVRSGFVTDLSGEECWKNKNVILWAFGHTHSNFDFIDDFGKRVIANQKGYYLFPQRDFQPSKVIEIRKATADDDPPEPSVQSESQS